jgi:hypothetical protein
VGCEQEVQQAVGQWANHYYIRPILTTLDDGGAVRLGHAICHLAGLQRFDMMCMNNYV